MNSLCGGYAFLAAADILNSFPEKNLKVFNRGISGNKVFQLADRWQKDCLDIKPSILSIMIGVNDFWHMHDGKYDGTSEVYEKDFRALFRKTKETMSEVKLVILEPYAVNGTRAVNDSWFPEFNKYREASRKIAGEFDAIFIPTHDIFAKAVKIAPPAYWAPDGVHPSVAGAKLIAEAWMKYVFGK